MDSLKLLGFVRPMLVLAVLLQPAALAQGELSAPAVGWTFDAAHAAARRIGGLPGAAILQKPLAVGFPIRQMAVSRRQDLLVAVSADAGGVSLIRTGPGGPESIELDAGFVSRDAIAISASGDAAAIYSASSQRLRIVRDLAKTAGDTLDLSVGLCEDAMLSVSDDGEAVAGLCRDGSLWLLNRRGEATKTGGPAVRAFVYHPRSREGMVLSREGDLYRVMPSAEMILERAGVAPVDASAAAWAATGDRDDLFALADGTVVRLNRVSGELSTHQCRCQPSGLFPTNLNDIVRLNDVSQLPIQLLEVSTGRFWFVPPDAAGDPN